MRGCLTLLAVFLLAFLLERRWTVAAGLPFADVAAAVLALGLTMTLGSLQGIAQAWRHRAPVQMPPDTWTEGALVRADGVLLPVGEPVVAPFSETVAVFVDYAAIAPMLSETGSTRMKPHWRGALAAPCVLQVGGERISLRGMPRTREWTPKQFRGEPYNARAARHVAETTWAPAQEIVSVDLSSAVDLFGGTGDIALHVMNKQGAEALGVAQPSDLGGPAGTQSALAQRIAARHWLFTERVVEPGTRVTVVGTFHASPRALDISLSPARPQQSLQVGSSVAASARNLRTTLALSAGIAILTLALHYLAFADGGLSIKYGSAASQSG